MTKLGASRRDLLVANPRSVVVGAFSLDIGDQLVRLAEQAAASAVLGTFALVMRHRFRLA
jgi:hypothetical protein